MQVFISYSQKDQKIAKALTARLAAAGMKAWLAEDEVLPGENLPLEVGKALERSDAMVVWLSPHAVQSRSVRSEISYALSSPKFEGRLIPVVLKPTKGIPWFLQTLPMIHWRGPPTQSVRRVAEKIVELLLGGGDLEPVLSESKIVHR